MKDIIRFEKGSQRCGYCGTKENIRQLVVNRKVKGLPIQEYKFCCEDCLKKLSQNRKKEK